jgi:hypothetical protein
MLAWNGLNPKVELRNICGDGLHRQRTGRKQIRRYWRRAYLTTDVKATAVGYIKRRLNGA